MDKPKKPPDKLPYLDPNVRGIFDLIIVTCAEVRQQRKTDEYRQAEKRREQAAIALRELRERERKEVEAELYRQQQATKEKLKEPAFIPFSAKPLLSLRESDLPSFVR